MASPTDKTALEKKALRDILGTDDPDADLLDMENVHDSEAAKIGEVWATVAKRYEGRMSDLSAFEREVQERMFDIGFVVRVAWEEAELLDGQRLMCPTLELLARTEKQEDGFDHERQAHEVQHDILGLGEKGSIGANGLFKNG